MALNEKHGSVTEFADSVDVTFVEDENLIFYYQVDLDDPQTQDDRIFLKSNDGTYDETLEVRKLCEQDGWVKLTFPEPENTDIKLTMTYDKGDENEVFTIFEDEVYRDMLEAQEESA
ncbi:hypothetical protein MNBD_GAMMA22-2046 [hydrothermal vent metagenome]|uniref:Uncharacterized protein n=1 Tax=hydrothermal vent metagenome TaxID=652676 RepID=A0A3B1B9C3_9ZZZZ